MTIIRVLSIDDHPAITEWIEKICSDSADFEFIGKYSLPEAVPIPDRTDVDIIVLDLILDKSGDLWRGLSEISDWGPKVLVFSVRTEGAVVSRALRNGAHAFVGKEATAEDMATALRLTAAGHYGLVFAADRPVELPPELTPTLQGLLRELRKTTSTDELAARLNYVPHTIEVYITRLYDILQTEPRNRARLVAQAEELGF